MKHRAPALKKQQFAFLAKNARKLSFEDQVILGTNAATILACFFPWASLEPLYGPTTFMNAFSGASWLIGSLVFGLALFSVALFWDDLFETQFFSFRVPRRTLLGAASIQSLLLQLCAGSVLSTVGSNYSQIDFRFGLAACLLLQIVSLVAVWLRTRATKKEEVKQFFQLPINEKSGESSTNHNIK
jgi:hypothetical protein